MLLGQVIGSVWGARQATRLDGQRLLQIRPLDAALQPASSARSASSGRPSLVVAVDQLGAGPGDLVLVTRSSRCRDLTAGPAIPTKDVVLAIVDHLELDQGEAG
jgi:ethanolamine utilization protein EutN